VHGLPRPHRPVPVTTLSICDSTRARGSFLASNQLRVSGQLTDQ
jgi:hypothetical protein